MDYSEGTREENPDLERCTSLSGTNAVQKEHKCGETQDGAS
mgnify:CR=1 FL=1|jgi:hypothetical protein